VHVGLGALDVVVEIVAEELDTVDGGLGSGRVGEVSGGEDWRVSKGPDKNSTTARIEG
jgi:hypothetical protein